MRSGIHVPGLHFPPSIMTTTIQESRKGTTKVNTLRAIEIEIQAKWEREKTFEVDAPDFISGYQRLKGKRCLFPFGLHCTGMPIKASADKLKYEMETFGYPPVFPGRNESSANDKEESKKEFNPAEVGERKKKGKSKVLAKTGGAKFQWEIMRSLGLKDEEIKKFADPKHWLGYFPPLAKKDLKNMGLKVDWRRSFITTDANPYYNSFVRWQFIRLKEQGKVKFGKRYTVYSPKDGQPCMDHDRASGENVGGQEYTLIKMKVVSSENEKLRKLIDKPVFFIAATLRPETMYGQTNCWVRPDMEYIAYRVNNDEIYVSTHRAARNISYQGFTPEEGVIDVVEKLIGEDLIGAGLKAPLSSYEKVYAWPMFTILEGKGTGIVTSVPSDSTDDYAALCDIKRKKDLRAKFNLSDDKVLPFDPVPIMNVPEFGDLSAVAAYEKLKITSQNDKEKLAKAKEMTYLGGFYHGVMLVGDFKGQKVQDIKKKIQKLLVDTNGAVIYMETEKKVMSRSGDECVMALCDQWYLDYGDDSWKALARKCLERVNTYPENSRKGFERTITELHEYACSRSYGLGTLLPCDQQYLIESLSDSTIYMAFYTVCHLLQGGVFDGSGESPLNIKADQMTPEIWDYIFHDNAEVPQTDIPLDSLKKLKQEFQYWYGFDLRSSGKDLLPNHLTYLLFNHVAIWPDEPHRWPGNLRINGHLLLNSEKMSKQTGNFLTLFESVDRFSADGMRLALADAGDSVEDANFVEKMADGGILRLYTFLEWTKDMLELAKQNELRTGPMDTFNDKVFASEINSAIIQTDRNYEQMQFREALKTGFYELQSFRDKYREVAVEGMHKDMIFRFIEVQILLLAPICPHLCEHVWALIGKKGSIMSAAWPTAGPVDKILLRASDYLMNGAHDFRLRIKNQTALALKKGKQAAKATAKPTHGTLFVAQTYPAWQELILKFLKIEYEKNENTFPENKTVLAKFKGDPVVAKNMKKLMPFVQFLKLTGLEIKLVNDASDSKVRDTSVPGRPYSVFFEAVTVQFINPQVCKPYFSFYADIRDKESINDVISRISTETKESTDKIKLYYYNDAVGGSRRMPNLSRPLEGKILIADGATFYRESGELVLVMGSQKLVIGTDLVYTVDL
ncbi:uncharacterized protein TRIADDRAFT_61696 [Trichoplax adhaerens]|uniref:leucine--tRNA ligase n=1 Tax=Trichoplax adhaerens TaxID=10228 RepID=B3SBQ2_TRIAD|nr:hypothetical protein TRIADDRAFT_61696 [Trichoplax adhaerens]EDV19829.1 hypothetical protein TRIADDRAFT_61696 [Trichoplax adhaerens]|eukprot:XP_002117699.1 hypothetical protein TRIADDRAFT_61696 [Trichoplax adhaerens]